MPCSRKNLRKELADKTAKEYFLEQSAVHFDELIAAGQNGLYVIVQSGEAVEIVPVPEGFQAKEWQTFSNRVVWRQATWAPILTTSSGSSVPVVLTADRKAPRCSGTVLSNMNF